MKCIEVYLAFCIMWTRLNTQGCSVGTWFNIESPTAWKINKGEKKLTMGSRGKQKSRAGFSYLRKVGEIIVFNFFYYYFFFYFVLGNCEKKFRSIFFLFFCFFPHTPLRDSNSGGVYPSFWREKCCLRIVLFLSENPPHLFVIIYDKSICLSISIL